MFDDDFMFASFGPFFGFPGVLLESPFDEDCFSFGQVLVEEFGVFPEGDAVDEAGFVSL